MFIAIFQGNFDKTIMFITSMCVDLSKKKCQLIDDLLLPKFILNSLKL